MNDTERDARIAECMGYLNGHFQRLLSFRIGNATLIKGAEADLWAWATNLRDAIQPAVPLRPESEGSEMWQLHQRCMNSANRADQAAERAQKSANLAEQACARAEAATKHRR